MKLILNVWKLFKKTNKNISFKLKYLINNNFKMTAK